MNEYLPSHHIDFMRKRKNGDFVPMGLSPDLILDRSIPEPNSGCWLWTGFVNRSGYGQTQIFSKRIFSAHRLSWVVHFGDVPEGMWVLHKCDVRCCVNPDHLFLGTHEDNMADMSRKRRTAIFCAEASPSAKLSARQVRDIFFDRSMSGPKIAEKYGVSSRSIYNIWQRKNWREITDALEDPHVA